jgi:hypothetical protein
MELIGVLDRRRLQRELQRREVALREVEQALGRRAAEPPMQESLVKRQAPMPPTSWECDFCGRAFHAYGSFLNHKCHEGD